jgi:hypothetical protein
LRGKGLRGFLTTAGERLEIECASPRIAALIAACGDGQVSQVNDETVTLGVRVERQRMPFDVKGLSPLTRSAWVGDGRVVINDVCSSGFDLRVSYLGDRPEFTFRKRPPLSGRAMALVLPARAQLLARSVLIHYPAMWWSGTKGRVPLHAPVCEIGPHRVMLAGPSGVGKSSLVARQVEAGGRATSDNLTVADGREAWGVVEPMRLAEGSGPLTTYGRREVPLGRRTESLAPDRLVVLSQGPASRIRDCSSDLAARALVSGTYMAGELRRYWTFAATLALATGLGSPHPDVEGIARSFARSLPCQEVVLQSARGVDLASLLEVREAAAWT